MISTSATSGACAEDIAERPARRRSGSSAIVIRSTVLPGTLRNTDHPDAGGRDPERGPERDFGVGFFPEFLRESTAVDDFYHPPKIVIAASDERTRALLEVLEPRVSMRL